MLDFLGVLNSLRNHDFGKMLVDHLDLVINDWYLQAGRVKLISRYDLDLAVLYFTNDESYDSSNTDEQHRLSG